MDFKSLIRVIPNFPQEGISFKDITTLLRDGAAYREAIACIAAYASDKHVDLVVGPEARGFVIGAPVSYAMGVGFVPVRKKGKLPAATIEASYDLEYGSDALAVHQDAILPGQRILIADDLLATGGTARANCELVEELGGVVAGLLFFIELGFLQGKATLVDEEVRVVLTL